MFTPPSIPEGQRDELADWCWELWAAEGKSYRLIAEQIKAEWQITVSHVTVGELVKEGKARVELPSRSDAALQVHTATRYLIAKLYEERRAGGASTVEIAPGVLAALNRFARLHGTDAPTRVSVQNDQALPTVDAETVRQVRAVQDSKAREVSELRAGTTNGEDPPP